jgi:hypothetical protein
MLIFRRRHHGKRPPAGEPPQVATPAKEVLSKRKPGRPKGSKNKKGK